MHGLCALRATFGYIGTHSLRVDYPVVAYVMDVSCISIFPGCLLCPVSARHRLLRSVTISLVHFKPIVRVGARLAAGGSTRRCA